MFTFALHLSTLETVRALTSHRNVLITRTITWKRVSPAPLIPAQTNDSLSTAEGGFVADDKSTSDQGGGELVDELHDDLAHTTIWLA